MSAAGLYTLLPALPPALKVFFLFGFRFPMIYLATEPHRCFISMALTTTMVLAAVIGADGVVIVDVALVFLKL